MSAPCQKWTSGILFDHIVCKRDQIRRHAQPEILCSLAVDDKLELGRLLDWQVGRLGAAQNFVDEVSGARERIRKLCTIGHQAARLGEVATAERRWQSGAQCHSDDLRPYGANKRIGYDIDAVRLPCNLVKGTADIVRALQRERRSLEVERASCSLGRFRFQHRPRTAGIGNDRERRNPGANWRRNSISLPGVSADCADMPVTLPPGRLKLSTKPEPTGSELAANTIGIVVVACFAASTGADPDVAMTSTPSLTNSAA